MAGGGHANVLAMPALAGRCRLTLVSETEQTPYSGMLPGFLGGDYSREDCFIHLPRLARACQAEWIQGRAVGIEGNRLLLADQAPVDFDRLSLNPGSDGAIPFPCSHGCPVKPVDAFIRWWRRSAEIESLAIVGGGAGGVEIAFAVAKNRPRHSTTLIAPELLPGFPEAARRRVRHLLQERGVAHLQDQVVAQDDGVCRLAGGGAVAMAALILAAGVRAPAWFANTGLCLDEADFICVDENLCAIGNPSVFVTGDAASHKDGLAKSGVMAVRQSQTLAHNLLAEYPKPWRHKKTALYILNTGDGKALACWGRHVAYGRWVRHWKHFLDIRFMRKLS